jgi:MATE family multidrug resistance protein
LALGPIPQAAHQVAISLAAMTYMMASGISSAAAAIRSGNYFGSGNHNQLRLSAISNYHIVIVFMSCTAIIFTLFNHVLPWIYTSDKSVITIAEQLLIVAAFFQLFDGTQVVGLAYTTWNWRCKCPYGYHLYIVLDYWFACRLPAGHTSWAWRNGCMVRAGLRANVCIGNVVLPFPDN